MTSEKRAQKFLTDDWLKLISHVARPIRSATQIWVVTRHQYGTSAIVSQTSFREETSGDIAQCRLFPQTMLLGIEMLFLTEMLAKMQQYGRLKRKKSCGNSTRNLKARMVCVTFVVLTTILCFSHVRKTNP